MQRLKRPWNEAAAKIDDVTPTKFLHTKLTHSCMHVILISSIDADATLSIRTQLIQRNAPHIHAALVIGIRYLFRPLSRQNVDILSKSGDLTCCSCCSCSLSDSLCLYKRNLYAHICTLLRLAHHLLDDSFSISCKAEQLFSSRTHSPSAARSQPIQSLNAASVFALHERKKPPQEPLEKIVCQGTTRKSKTEVYKYRQSRVCLRTSRKSADAASSRAAQPHFHFSILLYPLHIWQENRT